MIKKTNLRKFKHIMETMRVFRPFKLDNTHLLFKKTSFSSRFVALVGLMVHGTLNLVIPVHLTPLYCLLYVLCYYVSVYEEKIFRLQRTYHITKPS